MVGDWVMVNDIEHAHPLQVAEIFNKCGAYYATLYWDGMPDNVNPEVLTADVDKVLPIPLTPEILKKNGFEKWDDGWCIYDQENTGIEIAWLGTILKIRGQCGNLELHDIMYVHQLQHALRLCGITREIIV